VFNVCRGPRFRPYLYARIYRVRSLFPHDTKKNHNLCLFTHDSDRSDSLVHPIFGQTPISRMSQLYFSIILF